MNSKKGITLIILIITIVLVLILIVTTAATAGNAVDNSRITSLANDLRAIEDATQVYYMKNDTLPVLDEGGRGTEPYSKLDIIQKVDRKYQADFNDELNLNGDNPATNDELGTFYKIDLAKLDVEQTTRGLPDTTNPDDNDVYVVAYPSMHVYYLKGVLAKKTMYFSLSSKISSVKRITGTEAGVNRVRMASTVVDTVSGITVRKTEKTWTNQINLSVDTYIAKGEELYLRLKDGTKHRIMTVDGQNSFFMGETLTNIYSSTTNETYQTGVSETELNAFEQSSQKDKYVLLQKEKSGLLIGEIKVDLSNYEKTAPIYTNNLNDKVVTSREEFNHVSFGVKDVGSGIKEVRYEYLKKINKNGTYDDYYAGVNSYDASYMKTRGKKATVSENGLAEMDIPKEIEGIQVMIFDMAGNVSTAATMNPQSEVYVGVSTLGISKTDASFDVIVNTKPQEKLNKATIDSVTTELSTDGIQFSSLKTLYMTGVSDTVFKSNATYNGLTNVGDAIYVRTIVNYNGNTKKETRVQKFIVEEEKASIKITYDFNMLFGSMYWDLDKCLNLNNYSAQSTATLDTARQISLDSAIHQIAFNFSFRYGGGSGGIVFNPYQQLVIGQTYTWSVMIKTNRNMELLVGAQQNGAININTTNEYQHYTHTFVADNSPYHGFQFYTNTSWLSGDTIEIHSLQLKEGPKSDSEEIVVTQQPNTPLQLPNNWPSYNDYGGGSINWKTKAIGGNEISRDTLAPNQDTTYYLNWKY